MIEITIPGNPTTKKNSRENRKARNKRTGKIYHYQAASKAFTKYQESAAAALVIPPSLRDKFPIDYPVNVKSIYYRKNMVRCDLSNLHEATDDILVHYGILKDDNFKIVAGHDGSRVRIDRENPRVEITITKMEDLEK